MYVVTVLPMPEIIDLILCLDHKNLNVSLAVYFADFNVFITWPKHSPCVAQFLQQWTSII